MNQGGARCQREGGGSGQGRHLEALVEIVSRLIYKMSISFSYHRCGVSSRGDWRYYLAYLAQPSNALWLPVAVALAQRSHRGWLATVMSRLKSSLSWHESDIWRSIYFLKL